MTENTANLTDPHFEFNINTGYIYTDLCNIWAEVPRELFRETEWKLENILRAKHIITVPYTEEMSAYLNGKSELLNSHREYAKDINNPPYLEYFLKPNGATGNDLIAFNSNCLLVNGEDDSFDFFFALKLRVLDIMQVPDFLDYQFDANFKSNPKNYQRFLKSLLLKYPNTILVKPLQESINEYIGDLKVLIEDRMSTSNMNETHEIQNIVPLHNKEIKPIEEATTRQQALAIHFMLDALNGLDCDKTELARYIQFLTGKEPGAKKITDTRIYAVVKKLFVTTPVTLVKDLEIVKAYFTSLGMDTLVNRVNLKINENKRFIKNNKR